MNVIEIDDVNDPRLNPYTQLTDAQLRMTLEPAQGLFLAESEKVIARAIGAGYEPISALMEPKWLPGLEQHLEQFDVDVFVAYLPVLTAITGYRLHRGALAAFVRKPLPSFADVVGSAKRLVVLENLVDHTNVGLVFRSAAALGVDGVVISPSCADPLYRRSVKVSMGAVLTLPWTEACEWPAALRELGQIGFRRFALTPDEDATNLRNIDLGKTDRIAFLLGTEGDGLTPAAVAEVDQSVRIPMAGGVDSLNVAAAAAVAFYALGGT